MISVIVFSENSISGYKFEKKKKNYYLVSSGEIEGHSRSLIEDQDKLKEFLHSYFHSSKEEKFYVLIDGLDIQYKTVPYSGMDLSDEMDKKQIEEAVLMAAQLNLPKEVTLLHDSYTSCVLTSQKNEIGYLLSLAFIPSEYLGNIKGAFRDCGLNLMNVCPVPFGIFNAVNKGNYLFVYQNESFISVFSENGIYVWSKPAGCQISDDEMIDQTITDAKKILDAEEYEVVELSDNNINEFFKNSCQSINPDASDSIISCICAFGAVLPYFSKDEKKKNSEEQALQEDYSDESDENQEPEYDEEGNVIERRKGVLASVTGQLRKLFNFGRSSGGEV